MATNVNEQEKLLLISFFLYLFIEEEIK